MPQLVRTPLLSLFICSQRCSSTAFPFFGLDVTDILGSFEGYDGGAVVEVIPIARELLSLHHVHLDSHEATFLFFHLCSPRWQLHPLQRCSFGAVTVALEVEGGTCFSSDILLRSGGTGRGNATVVSSICEEGSVARSNCNG